MKRKIVIKLPMHNDKAKSKALKIVVAEEGVIKVSIGEEIDMLEVIGEGVDSVCLVKALRKKFCFADILSVEEVKAEKPPPSCVLQWPPPPCIYPPPLPFCESKHYDYCSIL